MHIKVHTYSVICIHWPHTPVSWTLNMLLDITNKFPTPLQYFCLENPMDGGAWWAAVHGIIGSDTSKQLPFTFHFHALEKEMATHSSVLAWSILGTGKPGGLPSMGSHRVGHNWSDLTAAAAAISFPNHCTNLHFNSIVLCFRCFATLPLGLLCNFLLINKVAYIFTFLLFSPLLFCKVPVQISFLFF